MNRQLKFRAWDKTENRMFQLSRYSWMDIELDVISSREVIDGYYLSEPFKGNHKKFYRRSDIELMQFTGLLDKNGKEIYEGDIFKRDSEKAGIVEYDKGCFLFRVKWSDGKRLSMSMRDHSESEFEIIGNIYEHGNLLIDAKE